MSLSPGKCRQRCQCKRGARPVAARRSISEVTTVSGTPAAVGLRTTDRNAYCRPSRRAARGHIAPSGVEVRADSLGDDIPASETCPRGHRHSPLATAGNALALSSCSRLKWQPRPASDPRELRTRVGATLIVDFDSGGPCMAVVPRHAASCAHYALFAVIDDVVLNTTMGRSRGWGTEPWSRRSSWCRRRSRVLARIRARLRHEPGKFRRSCEL